jgi:hypothetical protein
MIQESSVWQLKDNEPTLLQDVEAVCASRNPSSSDTEVTTGRGRHESRTAQVFSADTAVAGDAKTGLWSSTAEIACYEANSPIAKSHERAREQKTHRNNSCRARRRSLMQAGNIAAVPSDRLVNANGLEACIRPSAALAC